ncbi:MULTISPECIES: zf-HC2 domain-containing protein [unclassified Pseudonocardia]|uniref:zf-HC2 domain-containing protein n=1 Tax=unclassified Pseudonocardia TaxID=2619320 RepID=UPI00094B38B4|nr:MULTISPECIES: zf-HC2 domain-containing protein [unclassified Pseudonocardia]
MYDSDGIDCQLCREVVSAALDGEAAPEERAAADVHLDGCPACRTYAAGAERVTRLTRVRPAEEVPDIAAAVLSALGVDDPDTVAVPSARPDLTCLAGGCCGGDVVADVVPGAERSACGCLASCGCGCQGGAPCRCGTKAA